MNETKCLPERSMCGVGIDETRSRNDGFQLRVGDLCDKRISVRAVPENYRVQLGDPLSRNR